MQMEEMIDLIVSLDDELFNYSLFDWFNVHRLGAQLLTVRSRFVESYLVRLTRQVPTRYATDLLWRLHEKNGKYVQAAETLEWLADGYESDAEAGVPVPAAVAPPSGRGSNQSLFGASGFAGPSDVGADEMQADSRPTGAITLEERLEYLMRALHCLHNVGKDRATGSASETMLLTATQRVRDKFEMALVQCSLRDALQALRDRTNPTYLEEIARLDDAIRLIERKLFENQTV